MLAERQRRELGDCNPDQFYCHSLGLKPGTDLYVQCRLQARQVAAQQAAAQQAASAAMVQQGAAMMAAQPPAPPPPLPTTTNTNCNTFGNTNQLREHDAALNANGPPGSLRAGLIIPETQAARTKPAEHRVSFGVLLCRLQRPMAKRLKPST